MNTPFPFRSPLLFLDPKITPPYDCAASAMVDNENTGILDHRTIRFHPKIILRAASKVTIPNFIAQNPYIAPATESSTL
ncbi:hypothetical protein BTUL_0126g00290 [Botrytis tulipae]|uniref:Uncharacterized protein n=1 Tax=Botrytis tulipae TaxID=87230 RepID=A0A4Z1EEK3_9HELO|nr:hypothetical protein BTUL_0126g00290 [Botrytis tulipae]